MEEASERLTWGKAIGNGQTTRLWKHSWISLEKNLKPMGPVQEAALDLTVADLLTSDLQWNKQRIEKLLPLFVDEIQCLQPSLRGLEDSFIWQNTKSGVYSTKSGYYVASLPTTNTPIGIPDTAFSWIKDVWAGKFSPNVRAFMWSVIHNALPLGKNLQVRGNLSAAACIRCKEEETAVHCFFTCPFAENVWSLIPLLRAVHIAANASLQEIVVQFRTVVCLPLVGISHNILPWILWAIWTSRNILLFENRYISPEETASRGLSLAREWTQAQVSTKQSTTVPSSSRERSGQEREASTPGNLINCLTDAAWDKMGKNAGFGWVFEGQSLESPIHGSMGQSFIGSSLIAEAIAMRSTLCLALTLGFSTLRVSSDNSTLIGAISGNIQSKEIIGIVSDIRSISSGFASIGFSRLHRSKNTVAHSLAKKALNVFSFSV